MVVCPDRGYARKVSGYPKGVDYGLTGISFFYKNIIWTLAVFWFLLYNR